MQEFHRIVQQDPPKNKVPFWFFRQRVQSVTAVFCACIFGILAGVLLSAAGAMQEWVIPYSAGDLTKTFTIDEAISGPALFSYEIPNFYANQKRYVESKDNFLVGGMINRYSGCDDASDYNTARWRRCPPDGNGCDTDRLVSGIPGGREGSFRPCGLVALSMFLDKYRLIRDSDNASISLDESSVALSTDEAVYSKKILPVSGASHSYEVENQPSWLRPGDLEHFKVWYRTPASPTVRNLWATIPEGLEAGSYTLHLDENSPMWTENWLVPEKRVIISKGHSLGSPGGATFLGSLCVVCCVLQAVMACLFFWLPKRQDP